MKVLHIGNHFWPSRGGVEKIMLELALESQKKGIETGVLCLNKEHHQKKSLPAKEEYKGIPIGRVHFLNLKYYKPAWLPMEELKKADILHVHGISALLDFLVLTKWLHKKPIVVSTHGGIFHTANLSFFKKIYFFGWARIILSFVDSVVAVSKNDLKLFKPIAKKLVLIENGSELKRFEKCKKEKKRKNVFLFVGRLSNNKRIDNLLKVFGVLNNKLKDFELRIVGKDWQGIKPLLKKIAKQHGIEKKVIFVGEISEKELVKEYCQAGFFVSASEYEGFGLSTIEAMAAGEIPILNKIESFQNFIVKGKNGFLVDFSDAEKSAEKIIEIQKKDLEEIRKKAVEKAGSFSWDKKILEWKVLYDKIIIKGKSTGSDSFQ